MIARMWLSALLLALLIAAGRLFADLVVPPHLVWWLTPAVALIASLLTSAYWIRRSHLRRTFRDIAAREDQP